MQHTLRSLKLADNAIAELTMLCGFDHDLAGQMTHVKRNRKLTHAGRKTELKIDPHGSGVPPL